MITDNHGNYNREDHNYRTGDQGITSETTETKDPAVNQHQDDSNTRTHVDTTTDHLDREDSFDEKNASANDDPDDNDRNRRTLDESEADEEESDIEE